MITSNLLERRSVPFLRAPSKTVLAALTPAAARDRLAWLGTVVERGDPVLALGAVWLLLLVIQNATPNVLGVDGYYHIKLAWIMRHQGVKIDFPWLPFTILNPRDFTDHHLLYHLLLIPFTFVDLRLGAKAAGLVFGTLAIFGVYLAMAALRVRYPLLWLLALLGSGEWFLIRESMTRRQSVSLAMLVLATYLLIRGRYRWLLPVAFAYAWLFDGFVLLVGIVGLALAARLVAERRLVWPALGWTLLGLGLALVLNPYFPNNIAFTYHHVLLKALPNSQITVGNEWYPYSLDVLLRTSWLAVALVPMGAVPAALAARRALKDHTLLFLAGLAATFLVLYLRSRRFIETEPAFAVLFCAYSWSRYAPLGALGQCWTRLPSGLRSALAALLVVGVGFQVGLVVQRAQRAVEGERPYNMFETAARFVEARSEPLEPIFQTDWDDFPYLFFYNTHNTYIVGLDPTYMYLEQPELYLLWRSIGRGEVAQPGQLIRDRFGARWVITDRAHRRFIEQAESDPLLEVAFQSPTAVVFHVREADAAAAAQPSPSSGSERGVAGGASRSTAGAR